MPFLYLLAQIGIFGVALLCLIDAQRKHKSMLFLFLLFDAFIFEFIILRLYHAVEYNPGLFSLGGIPLMVSAGWAILLYALLGVAKSNNIFLKSLFIALAVTSVDLVLDRAAVGSGFWNWDKGIGYFGIPYNNFFAWYIYAFLVTLSVNLFLKKINFSGIFKAFILISATGLSLGYLWTLLPATLQPFLWWLIFSGTFAISIQQSHKVEFTPSNTYLLFIPLMFYPFSFILILADRSEIQIYYILLSSALFAFWALFFIKKLSVANFLGRAK